MKKFVQVFMGSRGILEDVLLVESKFSISDYCESIVREIFSEIDVDDDDYEEEVEMLSEFVSVEELNGFTFVGLNEEEHLVVFDFDTNKDVCEKLLKLWENEDVDGVHDIINNLDY